ncbi:hypothetical protein CYMTET_10897 [Cymbomonas tetramitiformis]|uniref:Uncharacterized protein n=1 Tax=Cymbomonas tetramitiformis TaxID=36881 RepID=A0AAE0GND8_9CHLO|nr:hypothetical protein CYMTET_10897 [Cymbomonas tetramitiformis]
MGTFIILDDDRITIADTWSATAGAKDLRNNDIFKCDFSNEQLQRLLMGEEQVNEKDGGGDDGVIEPEDTMAVDAEGNVPPVDVEADTVPMETTLESAVGEQSMPSANEEDAHANQDLQGSAPRVPSAIGDDLEQPLN